MRLDRFVFPSQPGLVPHASLSDQAGSLARCRAVDISWGDSINATCTQQITVKGSVIELLTTLLEDDLVGGCTSRGPVPLE